MDKSDKPYGFELILDLHGCDAGRFTRKSIEEYFVAVCNAIGMEREDLHFWDYEGIPAEEVSNEAHLSGTSALSANASSSFCTRTKLSVTGTQFLLCLDSEVLCL